MAKRRLHARAVEMRKEGMSYSQIKKELGVSKGTLSRWLEHLPLSKERIHALQDRNEIRIERYRATRSRQREERRKSAYDEVKNMIGPLSERDLFVAGLFLYWGEGGKTQYATVTMSNTDPAVLLFFKRWLVQLGADSNKCKVRLQLYGDMDPNAEIQYWAKVLELPAASFTKPYIKNSNRLNLTYKQRFAHGTCNLMYNNVAIAQRVLLGVERLREVAIAGASQM